MAADYKIEIDRELCIGDQMCVNEAPETFEMDGDSIAVLKNPEGNTPTEILAAAQNCPTDAICLHCTKSGEKVWPK